MHPTGEIFAQVIVPLPLYGTFTYRIPPEFSPAVSVGSRVIVPFGPRKFYTGIVASLMPVIPQKIKIKDIADILDDEPILRHPQLKLWEWISDYYLCTIGDVYKAAVPAGLKLESESYVEIYPDYEESESARLSDREASVIQTLDHHGKLRISDIERKTGLHNLSPLIDRMVKKNMVMVSEKLVERYRKRTEIRVALAIERCDSEAMHAAFDTVQGAPRQEQMLIALVDMLNKQRAAGLPEEVTRHRLLKTTGLSQAILSALVSKGIVKTCKCEIGRFQYLGGENASLPKLSEIQNKALEEIHSTFIDHNVTLLHGVTSSGKTEIYIHLIDHVLKRGEQALYLVPEIALTTQLTQRLQKVFGNKVIIYHSKFSDNERVDIWKRILHNTDPCVVIGARSAIFLPFHHLRLVIVDEEHEASYKQTDPAPRYNARDCAIVLAGMHGAKTLLGSATPAIETYFKATSDKYGLVNLSQRYEGKKLPVIEIIDTNDEKRRQRMRGPVTLRLKQLVDDAISKGEQAILFHNRRGYAPIVICRQCGYVPKCQCCDVSLTYHRKAGEMICHYCGATYPLFHICPNCREPAIDNYGYGTERIEDIADSMFSNATVMRMDLDTTRNKDSYEQIISDFSNHKAQILVGTQMVTKGLDFDGVSVVGVLNADNLINFPDFRSAERAFNMLEQVAGRAGRRSEQGVVVVQTSQPEHPIIQYLINHDYLGFYNHEIEERRRYIYPPYVRIINIYLKHPDEPTLIEASTQYGNILRNLFGNRIFGPEEPHISRIQSLYIRKFMLKIEIGASMQKVRGILRSVYENFMVNPSMRRLIVYYDVDPF